MKNRIFVSLLLLVLALTMGLTIGVAQAAEVSPCESRVTGITQLVPEILTPAGAKPYVILVDSTDYRVKQYQRCDDGSYVQVGDTLGLVRGQLSQLAFATGFVVYQRDQNEHSFSIYWLANEVYVTPLESLIFVDSSKSEIILVKFIEVILTSFMKKEKYLDIQVLFWNPDA